MEGHPAWMASISLRGAQGTIAAGRYTMAQRMTAAAVLRSLLHGVGDPACEVLFRSNVALFLHRRVSAAEEAGLPQLCSVYPAALPVQVLSRKGVPALPSTEPCAQPVHIVLDPRRPDLWAPLGCGACPSCRARGAIHQRPPGNPS